MNKLVLIFININHHRRHLQHDLSFERLTSTFFSFFTTYSASSIALLIPYVEHPQSVTARSCYARYNILLYRSKKKYMAPVPMSGGGRSRESRFPRKVPRLNGNAVDNVLKNSTSRKKNNRYEQSRI